MQKNESTLDRIIRAVAGTIIFYLAYSSFSGMGALIGYIVGAVLIFTAITGYCHMYKILGFSIKK
jgi:hypothetical protein